MTSTTLLVITGLGAALVAAPELPGSSDRGRGDAPTSTVSVPVDLPAAVPATRGPAEPADTPEPGSVDVLGVAYCVLCWS